MWNRKTKKRLEALSIRMEAFERNFSTLNEIRYSEALSIISNNIETVTRKYDKIQGMIYSVSNINVLSTNFANLRIKTFYGVNINGEWIQISQDHARMLYRYADSYYKQYKMSKDE